MSEHPRHKASTPNTPPAADVPGDERTAARPARTGRLNMRPVNLLLLIPLIGTLPPMFYNSVSPSIGGMPFFYWYQLLWIPISVTVTYVVYRATRSDR
jgi:hypothetical protein